MAISRSEQGFEKKDGKNLNCYIKNISKFECYYKFKNFDGAEEGIIFEIS